MPLCKDCVPAAGLSAGETCDRCGPNMSDNRTTIRATEEQKEWINNQEGTHWEVLGRLIENYEESENGPDESRIREIAREEITDRVISEAQV